LRGQLDRLAEHFKATGLLVNNLKYIKQPAELRRLCSVLNETKLAGSAKIEGSQAVTHVVGPSSWVSWARRRRYWRRCTAQGHNRVLDRSIRLANAGIFAGSAQRKERHSQQRWGGGSVAKQVRLRLFVPVSYERSKRNQLFSLLDSSKNWEVALADGRRFEAPVLVNAAGAWCDKVRDSSCLLVYAQLYSRRTADRRNGWCETRGPRSKAAHGN
jgi:hypothetical protein